MARKEDVQRVAGGRGQAQQLDRLDAKGLGRLAIAHLRDGAIENRLELRLEQCQRHVGALQPIGECRHIGKRRGRIGDLVEEIQHCQQLTAFVPVADHTDQLLQERLVRRGAAEAGCVP
jgi:hypothetical protein